MGVAISLLQVAGQFSSGNYTHEEETMYGFNKVIVMGRLGSDPEVKYTKEGAVVATLNIATSRRAKRDGNDKAEITDWHKAVCFNRKGEICKEYLAKGDSVLVEGRLQTRRWTDKEGKNRYSTEVIVDELDMIGGSRARQGAAVHSSQQESVNDAPNISLDESAEDVPF